MPASTDDLVLTPGGFRPRALVNLIHPGHELAALDAGEFAAIDVSTRKMIRFAKPPTLDAQFLAHGPGRAPDGAPPHIPNMLPKGWQTYAWWDGGRPITYFATDWVVPHAPSTSSSQTIFLFNGIENTGTNYGILQPVLQWGKSAAGGGSYWAVASWYVTSGGQSFHTNLVPVNAGDKLRGVMTGTSASGSKHNYNSTFEGIANTTLTINDIEPLHWANETLECYGMTKCSDFPATTHTTMEAIEIKLGGGHPGLKWTSVNAVRSCGQHTIVTSNDNPNGRVQLFYTLVKFQ